jgi:hypothetical protein
VNYTLRFLPEIEEDVLAGYAWYERNSPGLGEEFLRVFYASANEIPRNPFIFTKVHRNFHRRLLKRFPYAIYFMIEDNQIVVCGLFHAARNPRTIKLKLYNREK